MKNLLTFGFILVLVLPLIQGKSMIICEKEDEMLSCDKGVIQITKSTFGRTKSFQKCGFSFMLRTCSSDVTDIVSEMCDDKTNCTIKPRRRVYGNPCNIWITRIIQYINVTYECVQELTTNSKTIMTTEQSTILAETTQVLNVTSMAPVITVTDSKVVETTSTSRVSSETDITGLSSQSGENVLGDATGPLIGFVSGLFLITIIVCITLRQKRKRKYHYKNKENNSSYSNETYDSAIYRPRNNSTKVSNSSQGSVKPNTDYENLPSASGSSRPFFKNKIKSPHSKYSSTKPLSGDKDGVQVALIHDLKEACKAPNKQKKRLNQYVYTSVKNSKESSSNKLSNENQNASGISCDFSKPKISLMPTNKQNQNKTPRSENYASPNTKDNNLKSEENGCMDVKKKDSLFGSGNMDSFKCDSYYLDMSVTDGKTKDIDIKYVTMNRNTKPLDDVSIHLYVNDMNSSSYCNIQIQNKDINTEEKYKNQTGSDVNYDNIPQNKPTTRAVEESVYEPYFVE